jgi:phosphatidylglycerophosphate synthase
MSHDTWIHRVARVCVRPLVGGPVTPNHLTLARLGSGVAAAALVAAGHPPWTLAGCVLFLLSMLLDRADGELARLGGTSSAFGHRLDLWTDAVCDTLVVLSLGIAQRDGAFGTWAVLLGAVAALAVAIIFVNVLAVDRRLGAGSVVFQATAGFDPDDAIAVVPLAVVAGIGDWVLAAAAVATPLTAVAVVWHLRRMLRDAPPG